MTSALITSFASLWKSCTVPNWVPSGSSYTLLLRCVCVGCADVGSTFVRLGNFSGVQKLVQFRC